MKKGNITHKLSNDNKEILYWGNKVNKKAKELEELTSQDKIANLLKVTQRTVSYYANKEENE